MIIVLVHDAQTNQIQMTVEGATDGQMVRNALVSVVQNLDEQAKKPRLYVPGPIEPPGDLK